MRIPKYNARVWSQTNCAIASLACVAIVIAVLFIEKMRSAEFLAAAFALGLFAFVSYWKARA
jgi:uncharacterized membrane protein YozB (DUF420 family)